MSRIYLLDTSVIVRTVHTESSQHALAVDAIAALEERGDNPVLVSQVLIEFWSVATRPASVNGLGWTVEQVAT
jgi:predicted nucleic acid-binding protein